MNQTSLSDMIKDEQPPVFETENLDLPESTPAQEAEAGRSRRARI